jgi:galactosylceramide sulfotransferase
LDESLVLLKRILCWEMQDIIYIPVNVRFSRGSQRSKTAKLNKKDIKNLQKYNKADFLLYDFFKKRLLFQIQDADIDFQ